MSDDDNHYKALKAAGHWEEVLASYVIYVFADHTLEECNRLITNLEHYLDEIPDEEGGDRMVLRQCLKVIRYEKEEIEQNHE